MDNLVAVKYIDNYETNKVKLTLKQLFETLQITGIFKPKMKVLIKVCLPNELSPDSAKTTHPSVVKGVVDVLNEMNVHCIVAESPYKTYSNSSLDAVYLTTGMVGVENSVRCELNHNLKTFKLETPQGKRTKCLTLLDVVNEVDVIVNVGKICINDKLGYTGMIYNLFGLVPGEMKTQIINRQSTVSDFNDYLLDIANALKNKLVLNVLDGVVACEAHNTQRMLSCLAVSKNIYSLEAFANKIVGAKYSDTILANVINNKLVNKDEPFVLADCDEKDFVVDGFALNNINNQTKIFARSSSQKRYFKNNQQRVVIPSAKCKGCGICCSICPTNAIMMKTDKNGELFAQIDYKKCIYCNKCHTACPFSVLSTKTPLGYKAIESQIDKYNKEDNLV